MNNTNFNKPTENISYILPILDALKISVTQKNKKNKITGYIIIAFDILMLGYCFISSTLTFAIFFSFISLIVYVWLFLATEVNHGFYTEFIVPNAVFSHFKNLNLTFSTNNSSFFSHKCKINLPIFNRPCTLLTENYYAGTYKTQPIRISELNMPGYCLKKSLFISVETQNPVKKSIIIANKSFLDKGINKFNEIFVSNREFSERYYIQTEDKICSPDFNISSDLINKLIAIDKKGFKIAICKHFDNFDIIVDTDNHLFQIPFNKIEKPNDFHLMYPYLEESTILLKEISQLIDILNRENFIPALEYHNYLAEYHSKSKENTKHTNSDTFTDFFTEKIKPALKFIEHDRTRKLKDNILRIIAFGLIPFTFCYFVFIELVKQSKKLPLDAILIISAVSLFGFLLGVFLPFSDFYQYKKETKSKLYDVLFSYFGDFEYMSNEPIGKNWDYYKNIPLFNDYNLSPYLDERFKGIYNGILVNIEELKLNAIKGKVFDGLLFYFPYEHKKCKSTVITTNKSYPYAAKTLDRVKLEDIEFEKIYETYSNDQIEARYILTTAFMEKLKRLNKHNIKAAVCFHNGMVYIGVKTTKNLFEPPLFKSALDIENYKSLINQMKEILEIIDILEMDRKTLL